MVNRTKQAFWGVTSDAFWQCVSTILVFVTIPIIVQFISKPLYGFWIASFSILGYLGMMDLSLGMSLGHHVAKLPERDGEAFDQVVSAAFFSFLGIGLLVLVIGWGMSPYIPLWFNIPQNDSAIVVLSFRIAITGLAVSLPLSTFGGIISGSQHMAVLTTICGSSTLTGTVFLIILLHKGFGLISLAVSQFFTILITGLASYLFCKLRYYPRLKISAFSITKVVISRLWVFGGYLQLGRVANTVALSTDAILIAAILGAAKVPAYAFTCKLAMLVSASLVSKLPCALFPALSQMYANGEMEKIRGTFVRLADYSTRIAMVFGIFIILGNRKFVSLWVGHDFFGGNILNLVFVSWIFIDSLYRGTGVVIQASGNLKKWSTVSVIEALLNLGISIVLGRKLGIIGIALGTAISRTISGVWFMLITCDKTQLPIRSFIWRGLFSPMLRSVPSCCMIIIFAFLVPQTLGWVWLCLILSAGMVVNILSFEGIELIKLSNVPFKNRLRNIFALRPIY
ncbi:MAG: oligosaccharide flippase family protein [Planctomycetes bacterium]|nr:oligosaccharide flippase family protein [Planctomycetota bacterium]MBU1519056.1 oligosaccharide flippase family protein [Planctomycetota bacterium]MBU2596388.1 oligosaccharide flippase family protein [Planctomycetota bacterium]